MKKFIILLFVSILCMSLTSFAADTDKSYATRADALHVLLDTTSYEADIRILEQFSDADDLSEEEKTIFAYCVDSGLIKGYPDGTLRPYGNITRGEYAVIIERLRKDIETPKTVFDFDIHYDDSQPWCESSLKFCSANLIMLGYGNQFGIDDNLTSEQLQIIKKRFNANANYDDICVALLLQNLDDLDYDAVMQSAHDEKLRFAEEDIPKQSEESKEHWKPYVGDRNLVLVSYPDSEPVNFKYSCVLNSVFNTAFDYEKYSGNEEEILRLTTRISFLRSHSTMYGVNTPLYDEGVEIFEPWRVAHPNYYLCGMTLSERDERVSVINDKISRGVKAKAFFVSSAENYLDYTDSIPAVGTKRGHKAKGYEYFKYISGAPDGIENGKWYRRIVHAELSNGHTPNSRYTADFNVEYEEPEPVPEFLMKNKME